MISRDDIQKFPHKPGVYIMRSSASDVIYVGKARDLKKRVSSYLRESGDSRYHVKFLMERAESIEYLVTDTEKEALLLENNLIKKYRPRYNFNLKDDKTYFSIRLNSAEKFPRLTVSRKVSKDGARYFGPYSSGGAARDILKDLYRFFPLRHYPLNRCMSSARPCLYYQIKQCSAPCKGFISEDEYDNLVKGAVLMLEGKNSEIAGYYRKKMLSASGEMKYEEAARWRNLLESLKITTENQKVSSISGEMDIVGFSRCGDIFAAVILFIRGGSLTDKKSYLLKWELSDEEGVSSFVSEYYSGDVIIPPEIILPLKLSDTDLIEEILSDKRGVKVSLLTPQRGRKRELMNLACKNADAAISEKTDENEKIRPVLEDLMKSLHLEKLPVRIECYDISTFQGDQSVGSRAVLINGVPDKKWYRHYKIRGVKGVDDFSMLKEIFERRFNPQNEEPLPDLIVVDGGTGQLNILLKVLADVGKSGLDAVSLAKSRVLNSSLSSDVEKSEERVFIPERKNPVVLKQNSKPLLMLAHIRDEAHRFAITFHRKLRDSKALSSRLDSVSGLPEALKFRLLKHFGSVEEIKKKSIADLAEVKGIGEKTAERILEKLKDFD